VTAFSKYNGIGNDFVVVDLRDAGEGGLPAPDRVVEICRRRFGVGADGILPILPPTTDGADARMLVLNADGSVAEMCGNGIRCVVKHLWERDPAMRKGQLAIDTGAGLLTCQVQIAGDEVAGVRVDMGPPRLTRAEIPMTGPAAERAVRAPLDGVDLPVTCVSMGNPHAVAFVDDGAVDLRALAERHGPGVETHAAFPQRTNAELARVVNAHRIDLVVWERGCGITLACGTGACATAVAACLEGRCEPGDPITVGLPGGDLEIEVARDLSRVWMTGPAAHVFDGAIELR
jgi:diaminopimelate epimerase